MQSNFLISTGFTIKELNLIAKDKTERSLIAHYKEINIFDSILQPCLTGNILIEDSSGLSDSFLLDGNDFIKIHIGKVDDDTLDIKRIFRIYKQSDRNVVNQTKETYILHFISEEFVTAQFKKVGQAYLNTTYSNTALKILRDYLKTPSEKIKGGEFDTSLGIRDIIVPLYLNPIDAIMWMTKLAIDTDHRPCFLFYENIFGYNFASLSNLLDKESVVNINFDPKNLGRMDETNDMFGARHFEVIQQFDILSNIKNGVYSGKFIGYDRNIGQSLELNFDYNSINHPKNSRNNGPAVANLKTIEGDLLNNFSESNIVEGPTSLISRNINEIKQNSPGEFEKKIDYEQILFQRESIFANFFSQRVKLVVPGNFGISSGANVYLNIPKFSEKVPGENNLDRTLYGHYMIIAARHKLTPDNKHETIFEACTNSSNRSDRYNKMIGVDNVTNTNYA
jgi:hypothetical protein